MSYCATRPKVEGSTPDGVTEIFHSRKPSCGIMALESTQSLTKMNTSKISWGVKAADVLGLPPSCTECFEIWQPQSPGTLRDCNRPVQGLIYLCCVQGEISLQSLRAGRNRNLTGLQKFHLQIQLRSRHKITKTNTNHTKPFCHCPHKRQYLVVLYA